MPNVQQSLIDGLPEAQHRALTAWPLDLGWRRRPSSVRANTIDGLVRRGFLGRRIVQLAAVARQGPWGLIHRRVFRPRRRQYRLTADGLAEIARRRPKLRHKAEDLILDLAIEECEAERQARP